MCGTVSNGVKSMSMLICVIRREGRGWKEQDVRRKREWAGNRSKELMQQENERKIERSVGLSKEVKRKWYGYLPGLEPPCRLLPPAFSSPWSSWWRTVTWLPPGKPGVRKKVTGDSIHQYNLFKRTMRHKSKTTRLHVGHRLTNIKHPHTTQRHTEADRIYWGSEKGKVSTSL